MQRVILLYGFPACGKYTIAKRLAEKEDMHLVDNHFFNNVIYPFVNVQVETVGDISKYVYDIRKTWMDCVSKWNIDKKDFVFTNVLLNTEGDKKAVRQLRKFAKNMGYSFIAIRLHCDENDVQKRINTEDRKQRFKLTDYETYKKFISTTEFLQVRNGYQISTSNKTVDESVEDIKTLLRSGVVSK